MQNIVIGMPIDERLRKKLETVAKDGETPEQTAERCLQEWSDEKDKEIRKNAKHYRFKVL